MSYIHDLTPGEFICTRCSQARSVNSELGGVDDGTGHIICISCSTAEEFQEFQESVKQGKPMKSKIKKTTEVHLVLTEKEARVLKGLVQNNPYESREDEPEESIELRENIFKALDLEK